MSEQYVYGLHAVSAVLANPHRVIKKLFVNQARNDQRMEAVLAEAKKRSVVIYPQTAKEMDKRFDAHQGIVAEVMPLPELGEADIPGLLHACVKPAFILILDGVTDPHNLGACLRTADAAGVDFIMIPKDKSASLNATVSKVASGAAESVPLVRVTNLARSLALLKEAGIWIYGAAGEAKASLYQVDCKSPVALVLGAEGSGLRRLTRDSCDDLFSLPMYGTVDSLNVSVACGVSLYEVLRQRMR